ncbi:hypothetical protein V8J88_03790 [Massilia sp. W12]|uniref:hypothetical protein n=1 Tax=Massilia sp. W12 TaxID=3126507 RepID=UPI0030CFEDD6
MGAHWVIKWPAAPAKSDCHVFKRICQLSGGDCMNRLLMMAVLVVALVFGAGGYALGRSHALARQVAAAERNGQLQVANDGFSDAVKQQNDAVKALTDASKKAQENSTVILKQMAENQRVQLAKASRLAMQAAPTGVNECDAARIAFADELKKERDER